MPDANKHTVYLKSLKTKWILIAAVMSTGIIAFSIYLAFALEFSKIENFSVHNLFWMAPLTGIFLIWLAINLKHAKINKDIDEKSIQRIEYNVNGSVRRERINKKWDKLVISDKVYLMEHDRFAFPRDHKSLTFFYGENSGIITDLLENEISLKK